MSNRPAGIVLSGGASRRMGRPKALLPWENGTLAEAQLTALETAGCAVCRIVTGAHDAQIRPVLGTERCIFNERWREGRVTSVQTAMRELPRASGWLFLPVDAAGVRPETLRAVLDAASSDPSVPWRPCCNGRDGYALWIPSILAPDVLALPPDARLDEWAAPRSRRLECGDTALLRNLNTPEDWSSARVAPPPHPPLTACPSRKTRE